jgi:DNA-binding transcriptional regulator PaaX
VQNQSWVLLVYRIPREPSRHRVAVWRKLKDLGALYLQDGVAALPKDAMTHEQLEWLQLRVKEAGGEATLWEGRPNTRAEGKELAEAFRSSREEAYQNIITAAERVQRKAKLGGGAGLLAELSKLERKFRAERRRDYFRAPSRNAASEALRTARQAVREGESPEEKLGTGSES